MLIVNVVGLLRSGPGFYPGKDGISMASATATKNGKAKTLPVHKIRCGSTVATIWENEGEKGPWHNTTILHSYRDEQSGDFVESSAYSPSQLLELAACAQLSHAWIVGRKAELRAERRDDRTDEDRF
jgi:hypothetical protein